MPTAATYTPNWRKEKEFRPGTQPDEQPPWLSGSPGYVPQTNQYGGVGTQPYGPQAPYQTNWNQPLPGMQTLQQSSQLPAINRPQQPTRPAGPAGPNLNIPAGMTLAQWAAQNMPTMSGNVFNPSAGGTTARPRRPTVGGSAAPAGQTLAQAAAEQGITPLPGTDSLFQGEVAAANQDLYQEIGRVLEDPNTSIADLQYQQWLQSQLGLLPPPGAAKGGPGFGSKYKGWGGGGGGYGGTGYGGSNYVPSAYLNLFSWNYGE